MENIESNQAPVTATPVQYQPSCVRPRCKWNWGAFMSPIVFAFGTKSWLCLLNLVPFLNIVWMFIAAAKGEKWAWDSGFYEDEKSFRKAMQTWNRAGAFLAIMMLIAIAVSVLLVCLGVMSLSFNFNTWVNGIKIN